MSLKNFSRLAIYKWSNSSSNLFYPGSGNLFLRVASQLILLHELMDCICQLPQLFFNDPKIQYCFDTSIVPRRFLFPILNSSASDGLIHRHSKFIKRV